MKRCRPCVLRSPLNNHVKEVGVTDEVQLRSDYEAAGQGHVFAHVDALDDAEREAFVQQLSTVDLAWTKERYAQYQDAQNTQQKKTI